MTPEQLHRLVERAEQAAARCDAAALDLCNTELTDAFAQFAASCNTPRRPSKIVLQRLQAHVRRYAHLCAALGHTLRSALTQTSFADQTGYQAGGQSRLGATRHLIGGYG